MHGFRKRIDVGKPLVTIITVVFNSDAYIEETILSVLNQAYDPIEYIIIDGGSDDETLKVIEKYENYIDYWVSEPDEGIYDAMNKGALIANGECLLYLNSGDRLISTGFKFLADRYADLDPTERTQCILYGENSWQLGASVGIRFLPRFLPMLGRLPSHQAMLINREVQLLNLYNLKLPISADQDFKLRVCRTLKCVHYQKVIVESLPGGVSQRISSMAELKIRSHEAFDVFSSHYGQIWGFTYGCLFFIWNARKLVFKLYWE